MNISKYKIDLKPDFTTPEDLLQWMKANIRYRNFTMLQSMEQTRKLRSGSCHDQVIFELSILKHIPGITSIVPHFFMECDESGQGGITHSFVTYRVHNSPYIYWFENAAPMWAGIKKFKSMKMIVDFIIEEHQKGIWGNYRRYSEILFGKFSANPGDDLQAIVDKSL